MIDLLIRIVVVGFALIGISFAVFGVLVAAALFRDHGK